MLNRVQEEFCRIIRMRFRCSCGIRSPYCKCVVDLANLALEECEKEVS